MPSITLSTVTRLQPGEQLVDDKLTGFTVKRTKKGRLAYSLRYSLGGKQRWLGIGTGITPAKARELAEQRRGELASGRDLVAERQAARRGSTNTVNHVLDEHLQRYVRPELRSADEIERCFDKYIRPEIGAKSIYELRRRDVVELLDKVADKNGPVMADRVLAHLRKALNWWSTRDDEFSPPFVQGMARTSTVERARKRVLNDQEISDVFTALGRVKVPSCYPALIKLLLLSARRPSELTGMTWSEVESNDVWVIPEERGERQGHKVADRDGASAIPLTPSMRAQMGERQKRGYVFHSGDASVAFDGWSKSKRALDKEIGKLRKAEKRDPMPAWQIRDLRRTARSLMSRAGVPSKHAELALGHLLKGVERTYDRHEYVAERRDALERLGKLIERILAGDVTGNVVRPAQWSTA